MWKIKPEEEIGRAKDSGRLSKNEDRKVSSMFPTVWQTTFWRSLPTQKSLGCWGKNMFLQQG